MYKSYGKLKKDLSLLGTELISLIDILTDYSNFLVIQSDLIV